MRGISDLVYIIASFFILAVSFLLIAYFTNQVYPTINQTFQSLNATNSSKMLESGQSYVSRLDYLYAFIVIAMGGLAVLFAFLIPSHPIFFLLSYFLSGLLLFISIFIRDYFFEILASPIGDVASQFPITIAVMNYYPYIILLIVFVLTIAMYAKGGGGEF